MSLASLEAALDNLLRLKPPTTDDERLYVRDIHRCALTAMYALGYGAALRDAREESSPMTNRDMTLGRLRARIVDPCDPLQRITLRREDDGTEWADLYYNEGPECRLTLLVTLRAEPHIFS